MHLSECSVYMYSIVKEHSHLTKIKNNLEKGGGGISSRKGDFVDG